MKNNGFFKATIVVIVCNLIGKVLGAVYRIPLAKILGPTGIGMYQLIFPLYALILTISTSGVPVAISKLVAEYNSKNQHKNARKIFKFSLLILTFVSFIGALIVVLLAKIIAKLQGNFSIYVCYYGIAPAILFVGVLSAFRGYFQGELLMFPSAISSLIENVFKILFGLFLSQKFLQFGVEYAVLGAIIGITFSEVISVLFLFIYYLIFKHKHKLDNSQNSESFKFLSRQIFSLSIPVTLGSLIAPATSLIDSLLVVNLLMFTGFSSETSTKLLGLQSGVVEPLINIPVIIAISISTVVLPRISKLMVENSKEGVRDLVQKAFQTCLCVALTCAICYVIFGKQILSFLFGLSFSKTELLTATKLLFAGSFNIIFLSLVQVSAGVLQGLGYSKIPVKSLCVGCVIKIGLDCLLIPISSINIFGSVISAGACYLVVFFMNYKKIKKLTGSEFRQTIFYVSIQEMFICLFAFLSNYFFKLILGNNISLFLSGFVTLIVFCITYYVFFIYEKNQYYSENLTK